MKYGKAFRLPSNKGDQIVHSTYEDAQAERRMYRENGHEVTGIADIGGEFSFFVYDLGVKIEPWLPPEPDRASFWCARFKHLDSRYHTDPKSPLHHDNRCELHKGGDR